MLYRLAADSALLLHLAFIVFALSGGVFAVWWRWMPLFHLPAVVWAFYVELSGSLCPLTTVENRLRLAAGQSGYSDSFIEHYLLPLVYPLGLTQAIQWVLAGMVACINIAVYRWLAARRRCKRTGDSLGF